MTVAKISGGLIYSRQDLFNVYSFNTGITGIGVLCLNWRRYSSPFKLYWPKEKVTFVQIPQQDGNEKDFHWIRDFFFSFLSPANIVNFSEVNKRCYLMTKNESIWRIQLNKLLPNVSIIPESECGFSANKQFEVIFFLFKKAENLFKGQYSRNEADLLRLRGPNGNNGELESVTKEYESIKEKTKETTRHHRSMEAHKARAKYDAYQTWHRILAGATYDGTRSTIDPESLQGKLLKAIEQDVPVFFNDQSRFKEAIMDSKREKEVADLAKAALEQAKTT